MKLLALVFVLLLSINSWAEVIYKLEDLTEDLLSGEVNSVALEKFLADPQALDRLKLPEEITPFHLNIVENILRQHVAQHFSRIDGFWENNKNAILGSYRYFYNDNLEKGITDFPAINRFTEVITERENARLGAQNGSFDVSDWNKIADDFIKEFPVAGKSFAIKSYITALESSSSGEILSLLGQEFSKFGNVSDGVVQEYILNQYYNEYEKGVDSIICERARIAKFMAAEHSDIIYPDQSPQTEALNSGELYRDQKSIKNFLNAISLIERIPSDVRRTYTCGERTLEEILNELKNGSFVAEFKKQKGAATHEAQNMVPPPELLESEFSPSVMKENEMVELGMNDFKLHYFDFLVKANNEGYLIRSSYSRDTCEAVSIANNFKNIYSAYFTEDKTQKNMGKLGKSNYIIDIDKSCIKIVSVCNIPVKIFNKAKLDLLNSDKLKAWVGSFLKTGFQENSQKQEWLKCSNLEREWYGHTF